MECPYFKKCGGCRYINLSYEEQLEKKQQFVEKELREIASSQKIKIEKIIGSEEPLYYRNKVHSVFARNGAGKVVRGIYKEESHRVVDVKGCFLEDKTADNIIEEIKRLLPSFKYKVYDEDDGTGWLRHVLVRVGRSVSLDNSAGKDYKDGSVLENHRDDSKTESTSGKKQSETENSITKKYMVVLVTASVPFPGKNNFIKALRAKFPEISTIVQNINNKRTSMVLGERNIVCYGSGSITDELLGYRFRISANSFYQVNPIQTEKLYRKIIELAAPSKEDVVIDAYCGTGTIGSCLAEKASEVIGLELNPEAVKDAIYNARQNGLKNIRFINEDATKWMNAYSEKINQKTHDDVIRPDILIMDPPRSGSTPDFISSAASLKIPKIVYVSCNPETLSRDLKLFIKKEYKLQTIVPFDMFPWTEHCETCCLLTKS